MDYDKLKRETYLFLLDDNDDTKKLIYSILLISLCHDLCINDDQLLVSKDFIKNCCLLIPINSQNDKIKLMSDVDKFSLIRNKLAHGDYVYDKTKKLVYFKCYIDDEVILVSVGLNNIIALAKEITRYYDFLDSRQERRKIVIDNGVKMIIDDIPRGGKKRNESYEKRYQYILTRMKKYILHNIIVQPDRKNYSVNTKFMDINIRVSLTDEKDIIINNPNQNNLIKVLLMKIIDLGYDCGEYQEVIELLKTFYTIYIYPLENFLKHNDQDVFSLEKNEMFDFAQLDLAFGESEVNRNVSKTSQYFADLNRCYEKIGVYHSKLEKLQQYPLNNVGAINAVETKIDDLVSLFCTSSVRLIYNYSKNRSIIEHLRCSIMHGNYFYDEKKKTMTFIDFWQGEKRFHQMFTLKEFKGILNNENLGYIFRQFQNVYDKDDNVVKTKKIKK